jgi:hypothetical protein
VANFSPRYSPIRGDRPAIFPTVIATDESFRRNFFKAQWSSNISVLLRPFTQTMIKLPLLSLACGLSLVCVGISASPSLAQDNSDVYQDNESSSTFGNTDFNPFDLIHNSRLNNGRDQAEFRKDSSEGIDNAAANYRQQLLQYWKTQQQNEQTTPSTSVEATTPETDSSL